MNAFSLSGIFTGVFSLIFGIFVYLNDKQNKLNQIFLYFAISVSVWGFGVYKIGMSTNAVDSLFWWRTAYIGVIFIPIFLLHFTYLFLEIKSRKLLLIAYLTGFFYLLISYSDIFMQKINFEFSSLYYLKSTGFFYPLFAFLWFSAIGYAHYKLYKGFSKTSGAKKEQIKYFFLAMLVGFGGGSTCFLPIFNINIYPILNFTIPLYTAVMAYAIVRHHLMDIRVVVQKSIIYSLMLAIIVSFYLFLIFIVGFIFKQDGDMAIYISTIITTIIGIYGVPVIEKRFIKITDKIFFKDKYDYSEAIYSLSEILNKNIDLDKLLKEANQKLYNILKVEKSRIFLLDKKIVIDESGKLRNPYFKISKQIVEKIENLEINTMLRDQIPEFKNKTKKKGTYYGLLDLFDFMENHCMREDISVCASIKLNKKLIGIISLGKKKSGDSFSQDDINLLKTFSFQASTALVKAQLYEKVKEYSQSLEKKVEQRTSKIVGLQGVQKQMMVEMSHGLQTPLTIIRGELDMMKDDIKDKVGFLRIEKSVEKLSKFIYDMLSLAKLENVNNDIKKEDLNLSNVVSDLVEYFEVVSDEKDIKIINDIDENVHILGNKERLEEMITNFVSNSVKYMKGKRKKEIYISLKKEQGQIKLTIEDTGIGINKKDLKNIFARFYRSNDEAHSKIRGTGLGLAISKKIIEMHGGMIKAESKVGKGTKFIITL